MALSKDKNVKLYYSIKEVATQIGVNESTLRFWEKELISIMVWLHFATRHR